MTKRILLIAVMVASSVQGATISNNSSVSNLPYNSLTWDGVANKSPSMDAVRDALEAVTVGGITDGDKGDISLSSSGTVWTLDNDAATNAKLANVATNTIKGRVTASTGDPEDLTAAQALAVLESGGTNIIVATEINTLVKLSTLVGATISGSNTGDQTITLTGDVTGSGTGSFAATIADNSVDGTDIALGTDAQGDLMYYDGTNWVRLAAGTSGYFLKTQGAGANPAWDSTPLTSASAATEEGHIFVSDGATHAFAETPVKINKTTGDISQVGTISATTTSAGSLTFEGSTVDGIKTSLVAVDPTSNRTATLPNRSGTTVLSGDTLTGPLTGTFDADGSTTTTLSESWIIAISDETTDLTTGTAKVTFRSPYAVTVTGVRLNLNTVSSSGNPTVDINEGGTTILGTKLSCDASEKSSVTAASAATITDSSIADDAEITIDIDTAGTGAKGAKVTIYITR